jgi:hypothetical protein
MNPIYFFLDTGDSMLYINTVKFYLSIEYKEHLLTAI